MRIEKKRGSFYRGIAVFFVFFSVTAAGLHYSGGRTGGTDVSTLAANLERRNRLQEIYDVKFTLSDGAAKTLDVYIPVYEYCDAGTAEAMAYFAGFFGEPEEFDDFYRFAADGTELDIYKYVSYMEYSDTRENLDFGENTEKDKAIELAETFLAEKFFFADYESVSVLDYGEGYNLSFVPNLGGYENHAFPAVVDMDKSGNIKKASRYFFEYEKFDSCRTKSMYSAFLELPDNIGDTGRSAYGGGRVDLKNGSLVYIFENSIIQPAYMFSGEVIGADESFLCFVPAALYK